MFVKVRDDLGLVVFHRAAASSLTNALPLPWSEVSADVFARLPERVAFIREPHDRIVSAYRMFVGERESLHDTSSFDKFVADICLDHKGDPHVVPQAVLASPGRPARTIRWDFAAISKLLGVEVPHDNPSTGDMPAWDSVTRLLFDAVYQADIAWWNQMEPRWTR